MSANNFPNFSQTETVYWEKQNVTGNIVLNNINNCILSEDSLSLALLFSYSIIFLFGLIGNATALYVFLRTHGKKNSIQVYFLNVAIADLLLVFCLPFRIFYHIKQNKWLLGLPFCKIVGNLFYMNMYISIVLLGMISFDRYAKINRSVQRLKVLTTKRSIYVCCTLWLIALLALIMMVVHSTSKEDKNSGNCFHYREKQNAKIEAGFNYFLVIIFWIVFILLILSYAKIANYLLKISREQASFPNTRRYIAIARNSFIVLIIFTICFVPYHVFRFIYITSQLQNTSCYWKQIIHKCNEIMLVLSSFNSCLDPVMYLLMSRDVRKTVFQLICKRLHIDFSMNENTSETKQGDDNLENSSHHSRIYFNKLTARS
uniref:Probable G-protein coupled receptor 34 n=1 Tax=Salvator merianae TaxID=96440 RepID=A0A8D0KPC2_SALMN